MQIGLFQSATDEEIRSCLMFPDPQIAKGYKLNETKMKYRINRILEFCKKRFKEHTILIQT